MCFSNKCPYERRSGECGKRAWQVCPESFETQEEAKEAAELAAELRAEHEWNRQNEEGPWI